MVWTDAVVRVERHVTQTEMRENLLEDGVLKWSLRTAHTHLIKPQLGILLVRSFCVVPALGGVVRPSFFIERVVLLLSL